MLAGIRTFLQLCVNLTPCNNVKRILFFKLFPAVVGGFQIKLIAFLLGGIDLNNELMQQLGMDEPEPVSKELEIWH